MRAATVVRDRILHVFRARGRRQKLVDLSVRAYHTDSIVVIGVRTERLQKRRRGDKLAVIAFIRSDRFGFSVDGDAHRREEERLPDVAFRRGTVRRARLTALFRCFRRRDIIDLQRYRQPNTRIGRIVFVRYVDQYVKMPEIAPRAVHYVSCSYIGYIVERSACAVAARIHRFRVSARCGISRICGAKSRKRDRIARNGILHVSVRRRRSSYKITVKARRIVRQLTAVSCRSYICFRRQRRRRNKIVIRRAAVERGYHLTVLAELDILVLRHHNSVYSVSARGYGVVIDVAEKLGKRYSLTAHRCERNESRRRIVGDLRTSVVHLENKLYAYGGSSVDLIVRAARRAVFHNVYLYRQHDIRCLRFHAAHRYLGKCVCYRRISGIVHRYVFARFSAVKLVNGKYAVSVGLNYRRRVRDNYYRFVVCCNYARYKLGRLDIDRHGTVVEIARKPQRFCYHCGIASGAARIVNIGYGRVLRIRVDFGHADVHVVIFVAVRNV